MSWIAVGLGVGAGSSILSGIAQNQAQARNNERIRESAMMQAKIKKKFLKQSQDIKMNELYSMTEEFDREVGVDLTNLLYESEKMKGQIANTTAFRNVSGNASARLQNTAEIQKELSNDMLQQEVQGKYLDLGKEINATRLNYDRDSLDITMGLMNALSQQNFNFKSPLELALGGATAGASGALTGYQLGKAFG